MKKQYKHFDNQGEWEAAKADNKQFFEDKKRADELVILDDLRAVLGQNKFDKYVVPKIDIASQCLGTARRFICADRIDIGTLGPEEHQHLADSVSACIIASLVEPDVNRAAAIQQMIKESEGCARTNYQFVRSFLRRNLAGLLKAHNLDPASFPSLFPNDVLVGLSKGWAAKVAKDIRVFCKKAKPVADILTTAWNICQALTLGKGEFTHFEEVFPVLKALSKKGDRLRLGIIVCKDDRYKYIDERVWLEAKSIACQKMMFEVFRYYVFPTEYILMISGDPGQFLIFWGRTVPNTSGAARLAAHDWDGALVDGDVVMVDGG
ncbi:hypothetical protein ACFL3G_11315 [Planctomycetota bacterium]